MSYERITPKDLVVAITLPPNEDMTRILRYIHRLWELENAIERGELVKASTTEGIADFEKYLGKWLLDVDEDCCSRCAYCPVTDLCENMKTPPKGKWRDEAVCLRGLKEYAEKHAGQK